MLDNKCYLITFSKMYITLHHAHLIHHTNHQSKSKKVFNASRYFVCNIIYIINKHSIK